MGIWINIRNINCSSTINNNIIMAKEKIKLIKSGKLDPQGAKKIGKSFLISLAGAAVLFIANITTTIDFGTWQPYVAAMLPFVLNFLRKWLGVYTSKQ